MIKNRTFKMMVAEGQVNSCNRAILGVRHKVEIVRLRGRVEVEVEVGRWESEWRRCVKERGES